MCYDITNYDSFQNLDDWYRLVVRTFTKGKMPYMALIGNKCEEYNNLSLVKYTMGKYDMCTKLFS